MAAAFLKKKVNRFCLRRLSVNNKEQTAADLLIHLIIFFKSINFIYKKNCAMIDLDKGKKNSGGRL